MPGRDVTTMQRTVLLVTGDDELSRQLGTRLTGEGMTVAEVNSGIRALALAQVHEPDLVITDLGLPDMTGLELCDKLRTACSAPTLLLGVMLPEERELAELQESVSDYVAKPFEPTQVVVRALRLLGAPRFAAEEAGAVQRGRLLSFGDLTLDLSTHRVTVAGREVRLRPTEVKLLRTLIEYSPRVVSPDACVERVWPNGSGDLATLGDTVMSLRAALEDDPLHPRRIRHVADYGYRLDVVGGDDPAARAADEDDPWGNAP